MLTGEDRKSVLQKVEELWSLIESSSCEKSSAALSWGLIGARMISRLGMDPQVMLEGLTQTWERFMDQKIVRPGNGK